MRSAAAALLGLVGVAAVIACHMSVTEQRAVEIKGEAPLQQKLALVQRVGSSVLSSGLHEKIRARFPNVTDEQLRGLSIRWQKFVGVEVGKGGTSPVDKFYLQCTITLPRSMESTAAVLDYCKELLESELARTQAMEDGKAAPLSELCGSEEFIASLDPFLNALAESQQLVGEVVGSFESDPAGAVSSRQSNRPGDVSAKLRRAAKAIRQVSPSTPSLAPLHAAILDYARALDRAAVLSSEGAHADPAYPPLGDALQDVLAKAEAVENSFPCQGQN